MIPSSTFLRVAFLLARVVPAPVLRGVARAAGAAAYLVAARRRRIILDNLAHIVPDESPATRRRLARRTFRNLAAAAADLFRLPSIPLEQVRALMELRGREHLDAALAAGKGVIIVTAHLGPYELGGAWLAAVGYPVHAMVEDLAPAVADALATYRRASGMQLIPMRQGIREAYRLLGEGRIVVLVADRVIGDGRTAITLPFCDGSRPIPTGPAACSIATGAPILVGHVIENPARAPRYLATIDPPLLPAGRGDEERLRLTRQITERLSAAVQAHPDQWYVFQPQWVSGDQRKS